MCVQMCVFVTANWCLCCSRVRVHRLMGVCVCVWENVFDALCISAMTGATVVLCFKLLVCLARCFVWLRNGVNRGKGKQPGG